MLNFKDIFKTPTAHELAVRELAESERELLKARSGLEYAIAMVGYRQSQVDRLRKTVHEHQVVPLRAAMGGSQ